MNRETRLAAYMALLGPYTNSELSLRIDDVIHSERDRRILKRRFIDGVTYEKIAEEFELSDRHVKTIVRKYIELIKTSL